MEKGDIVTIHDFSYAKKIIRGILIPLCVNTRIQYTIVEVDCWFPLNDTQPRKYQHDTILQAVKSGEVVISHLSNLTLTIHTIIIDGKTIEISNESYQNLKEQLT